MLYKKQEFMAERAAKNWDAEEDQKRESWGERRRGRLDRFDRA